MAYLALYRRYRPQTFDEVVGQEYVTRILKNQILNNRIAHAYLLTGIRGTGKTSIAKIFARAVNCPHPEDGNPCNKCEVCAQIDKPGISDVIEIDAASNRGVDEIRDIREKVKYPPVLGRYKVYIIDEVHMLTKEAFNALLKTLEEPPAHIIFILATTEPNKLPMTILSRCQRYDIRPISTEEIAGRMKHILDDIGVAIDDDALSFIAARGDHSMRDALSLLDQIIDIREGGKPITREQVLDFLGMADTKILVDVLEAVIDRDAASALTAIRALYASGKNADLLIEQLIETLRDIIVAGISGSKAAEVIGCGQERAEVYAAMAKRCGKNRLFNMTDALIDARGKMRYSDMAGVILEMSLLSLCVEKAPVSAAPSSQNSSSRQSAKKQSINPGKARASRAKANASPKKEPSLREMMGLPSDQKSKPGNTAAAVAKNDKTAANKGAATDIDAVAANESRATDTRPAARKNPPSGFNEADEMSQPPITEQAEPAAAFENPSRPDMPAPSDQPAQTNPSVHVVDAGTAGPTANNHQSAPAEKPAQGSPSAINTDDLYRKLKNNVRDLSKGILYNSTLDHCLLAERGGTLVFRAEKAALSICEEMITDRDFTALIQKELSYVPALKAELYTKDYETMSFTEKTEAILEGQPVTFERET